MSIDFYHHIYPCTCICATYSVLPLFILSPAPFNSTLATSTPDLRMLLSPLFKNWIPEGGLSPPRCPWCAPGAWHPQGAQRPGVWSVAPPRA